MAPDDIRKPGGDPDNEHELFPSSPQYGVRTPQWNPPIDIYETGTHVVAIAELPGILPDDIRICFNDNVLTISGTKKKVSATGGCSFFRVERYYGTFKRSFQIVSEVDKQEMDATFDAGILTILMPKIAGEKEGTRE